MELHREGSPTRPDASKSPLLLNRKQVTWPLPMVSGDELYSDSTWYKKRTKSTDKGFGAVLSQDKWVEK